MKKPRPPAATPNSDSMGVEAGSDEARQARMAALLTSASVPAAMVITSFSKVSPRNVPICDVLASLNEYASQIKGGDLCRIEAMLGAQASALNIMFAELARRGAANMDECIVVGETYLRLALKTQSQCRATLETLAAIKNPPVVYAKQANIAHGPQQVNNEAAGVARVENIEKPPTELLEHDHGQRLDIGTTRATISSNQAVEAVATVHRPANSGRKSQRKP